MNDDESYSWPPIIPITEDPEEVLSRAFYELKHPVFAIKGFADLILKKQIDSQEGGEHIFRAAENIEVVLNAIYDYLRVRRNLD